MALQWASWGREGALHSFPFELGNYYPVLYYKERAINLTSSEFMIRYILILGLYGMKSGRPLLPPGAKRIPLSLIQKMPLIYLGNL